MQTFQQLVENAMFELYLEDNATSTKKQLLQWLRDVSKISDATKFFKLQYKKMIKLQKTNPEVKKALTKLPKKLVKESSTYKAELNESTRINESFGSWAKQVFTNAIPSLEFLPMLNVFIEVDKFLANQDFSIRKIVFYGIIYLIITTLRINKEKKVKH